MNISYTSKEFIQSHHMMNKQKDGHLIHSKSIIKLTITKNKLTSIMKSLLMLKLNSFIIKDSIK